MPLHELLVNAQLIGGATVGLLTALGAITAFLGKNGIVRYLHRLLLADARAQQFETNCREAEEHAHAARAALGDYKNSLAALREKIEAMEGEMASLKSNALELKATLSATRTKFDALLDWSKLLLDWSVAANMKLRRAGVDMAESPLPILPMTLADHFDIPESLR